MNPEILKDTQFIFIIGAPRSGTTLLFNALSAHPGISSAGGNEPNIFNGYIAPLVKMYEKESGSAPNPLKGAKGVDGKVGLALLLNREKFDEFVLQFIQSAYLAINSIPQRKVIVDKTPINSIHVDLIHYYLPDAKFIHITRDGRDVAYSWNKVWAKGFGNPNFKNACRDLIVLKERARKAKKFSGNYYELRYEDLLANFANELTKLFAFCKLNATPELIQSIHKQNTGEENMVSAPDTSVSYSDRISGKPLWKMRLSKNQLYIAKKYLKKDLIEEGYEKDENWGLAPLENMVYAIKFATETRYIESRRIMKILIKKTILSQHD